MKIKAIKDFGAVFIEQYISDDPKQIFYDVYNKDHELLESFKTAKQAKKFCKKWMLENIFTGRKGV